MPTAPMHIAMSAAMPRMVSVNVVRDSACVTNSLTGVTAYTGTAGAILVTIRRTSATSPDASPLVRTTNATSRGVHALPATLSVSSGRYTVSAGGWSSPASRTLPTTPMMVDHGSPAFMRMRRPTGDAPCQYRWANASLTIASRGRLAGSIAPSIRSNTRPARSGMPIAWKYPGVTNTIGWIPGMVPGLGGRSSTSTALSCRPSSTNGSLVATPAAPTPGSAASESDTWATRRATSPAAGYSTLGIAIRNASAWPGANPGSTARSAAKLRANNPAPASSTSASATWATTSARRAPDRARPPDVPAPVAPNTADSDRLRARTRGTRLTRNAASAAAATATMTTIASTRTSPNRGTLLAAPATAN